MSDYKYLPENFKDRSKADLNILKKLKTIEEGRRSDERERETLRLHLEQTKKPKT